jgi:ABC-type polar amino acid transport system ATPase subunit
MIEIADEGMAMICVSREMSFVKTVVRNYSLAKLSLTRFNLESSVGREKDEHTFVNQLRNPGSSVHDVI